MPVAVITGASKGLGLALTADLRLRGWDLVVDSRHAMELNAATGGLSGDGALVALPGDVNDPSHLADLASAAAALGGVDVLVNNASTLGVSPLPSITSISRDTLMQIYATNVAAPVALIRALLPQLRNRHGRVVNISSDAAVEAYETWGGYGSSKAALDQVSAVLAVEQPELHVYAFDPGDMRTQMQQDAFPDDDISDRPEPATVVPALLRLLHEALPSGRYRASDLLASAPEGALA